MRIILLLLASTTSGILSECLGRVGITVPWYPIIVTITTHAPLAMISIGPHQDSELGRPPGISLCTASLRLRTMEKGLGENTSGELVQDPYPRRGQRLHRLQVPFLSNGANGELIFQNVLKRNIDPTCKWAKTR